MRCLFPSNHFRKLRGESTLRINLYADTIPSLKGAKELFRKGVFSTLAPSNRNSFYLLKPLIDSPPLINLELGNIQHESTEHQVIKELIVDPQTCGPLLISCPQNVSKVLMAQGPWIRIGLVDEI